ncbi:MAG TPA: thioesterase family protein [Longimicrobiales bacterium]|nr:thioesterase family protein [Longimicrobiales bacterium]
MPESALAGFPIVIDVPVAWGDMDAFGHVNNTVFFRWFESARIAYLRAIDFTAGGEGGGVGPILASTHCRFRRPLGFPDTVRVGARTTDVGEDRFTMEYRVVSEALGEVAGEGGGVVVSYDYGAARKASIPGAVRARILALGVVGPKDAGE